MACDNCKGHQKEIAEQTVEKNVEPVPYIVHEAAMARAEREHEAAMERLEREHNKEREQHKRVVRWLCAIIIVLSLGLIGMFIYETQFESVTITAEQEADGNSNNYALGGDYYGGPSESNN
jgi:hypothetical protein